MQWRASSGVLAGAHLACFWLVGVEWGWSAVGSLCASLILGIEDTSGGIRTETSFSLYRSNTLYITWGGLLERHVKFVSYSFSHGSQKELLLRILGYGLKFNQMWDLQKVITRSVPQL